MSKHQAEALRLAEKFAAGLCRERDYPRDAWVDCIQEGRLAALASLPRWQPSRSELATFLYRRVRGAVIDYRAKQSNGGLGGKHVSVQLVSLQDEVPGLEDFDGEPLAYEDVVAYSVPPEGFRDPLDELIGAEDAEAPTPDERVALLMSGLTKEEEQLLHREYGLSNTPTMTQQQLAAEAGISHQALRMRIVRTLRKMKKVSEE